MQLIVYFNRAVCADELGYGHFLFQALCTKGVSAFQVPGAALLVSVPPFAIAWHELFGQVIGFSNSMQDIVTQTSMCACSA